MGPVSEAESRMLKMLLIGTELRPEVDVLNCHSFKDLLLVMT